MKKAAFLALPALLAAAPSFARTAAIDQLPAAEISVPAPSPARPAAAAAREWTIMVYMNGKNDLSDYAYRDLKEMEAVGSNDKIGIVAEYAQLESPVKRYYVTEDKFSSEALQSKMVLNVGKADMGDWRHLVDFARWTRANYPAKRYLLIVWNHGSGWRGRPSRGISQDDETGNKITTAQLARAMKEIGKVDILAYDACLMQMAEVAYEVRAYADVIVGSEETAPSDGYPYEHILRKFMENPAAGPEVFGKHMANMTAIYYTQRGDKTTQSAIRTSALDGLLKLTDEWAKAAMASPAKAQIKKAFYQARTYDVPENKDLYDFVTLASQFSGDAALAARTKALTDYMTGKLVIFSAATSFGYGNDDKASHGLAVYLPNADFEEPYLDLQWSRDGVWDDLVKSYNGVEAAK